MADTKRNDRANTATCWGSKAPDINSLITERAYRIFEQKGYNHGHDLDNWLEAERQVLGELKKNRKLRIL